MVSGSQYEEAFGVADSAGAGVGSSVGVLIVAFFAGLRGFVMLLRCTLVTLGAELMGAVRVGMAPSRADLLSDMFA